MADETSTPIMKGWRTLAFNAAVAVVGVLSMTNWADLVPPQYAGALVAAIGFINMLLRSKTTAPVGVK